MTETERAGGQGVESQAAGVDPDSEAPSFVLTFGPAESDFLCRYYEAADTILEYGSGGSSVLAAELGRTVYSVESDKAWAERLAAHVAPISPKAMSISRISARPALGACRRKRASTASFPAMRCPSGTAPTSSSPIWC